MSNEQSESHYQARAERKDTDFRTVSPKCDFAHEANFIVFADPRGGSSWITELIARVPHTAVLWEPLHLSRGAEPFKKMGFSWRQFIPEAESWPEAKEAFTQLFRGKLLNEWTCQHASHTQFLQAERMVVKFCRANGMIPWLTKVFSFKYDPIYLVRHPVAVAASALKHPAWSHKFKGYNIPQAPCNEPYLKHREFLTSLKTKEEAIVATWCLANRVPLRHARNNKSWITVYYEDLILDPAMELRRIFERWQLPMPEGLAERARLPSASVHNGALLRQAEKQVSKWKRFFSARQLQRLQVVLDYFKVAHYSTKTPYPLV